MSGSKCICFYKFLIAESVTTLTMILEFLFLIIVVTCGVIVNLRYRNKLQKEKRSMPIERRGNLIEPVMSWYCILQIIFWPYDLLLLWISTNEVIPSASLPSWLCHLLLQAMKTGRMCVAYNSLIVSLIRYVFIVQYKRSNQWNYEKVSNFFKITSITFPIIMELLSYVAVTNPLLDVQQTGKLRDCIASAHTSNSTTQSEIFAYSEVVDWTMQHLPISFIHAVSYTYKILTLVVWLNITEALMYLSIFRCMRRYNHFKLKFSPEMIVIVLLQSHFLSHSFRSNENSFMLGVTNEELYGNANKRRLVSLKICFTSWLYELIGILFTLLTPTLLSFGFRYVHYPDAILMFVVIPVIHLINDEDTKTIILEEGWIQGFKSLLRIRDPVVPVAN